jgi:hypothetical protein
VDAYERITGEPFGEWLQRSGASASDEPYVGALSEGA